MSIWIGIALAAALALLLVARRRSDGSRAPAVAPVKSQSRADAAGKSKRPKGEEKVIDKFKGLMLVPQKGACEAAIRMRSKTLPDGFVQQIPVPGCDRGSCECKLSEVRGRRGGPRRVKADRRDDVRFKEDRRKGRDRRQGVDAWNRGNS
jgi:hypothetical protein